MARKARIILPGLPHLVVINTEKESEIFKEHQQIAQYFALLTKYSEQCELDVWAYSIVQDQVNCVVFPQKKDSFSETFRIVNQTFSRWMKRQNGDLRGGRRKTKTFWNGRPMTIPLDRELVAHAILFTEMIPVLRGFETGDHDYVWSSYQERNRKKLTLCKPWPRWLVRNHRKLQSHDSNVTFQKVQEIRDIIEASRDTPIPQAKEPSD